MVAAGAVALAHARPADVTKVGNTAAVGAITLALDALPEEPRRAIPKEVDMDVVAEKVLRRERAKVLGQAAAKPDDDGAAADDDGAAAAEAEARAEALAAEADALRRAALAGRSRVGAHRDGEYAAQKALQIERFAAVLQSTREALDAQAAKRPPLRSPRGKLLRNSPRGKAPPPPPDILDEPSRGCAQVGPASPRIPPVPFEQQKGFFVGDKVKLFSSPEWSPRDCGTTAAERLFARRALEAAAAAAAAATSPRGKPTLGHKASSVSQLLAESDARKAAEAEAAAAAKAAAAAAAGGRGRDSATATRRPTQPSPRARPSVARTPRGGSGGSERPSLT